MSLFLMSTLQAHTLMGRVTKTTQISCTVADSKMINMISQGQIPRGNRFVWNSYLCAHKKAFRFPGVEERWRKTLIE